jgi:hypothetical protein
MTSKVRLMVKLVATVSSSSADIEFFSQCCMLDLRLVTTRVFFTIFRPLEIRAIVIFCIGLSMADAKDNSANFSLHIFPIFSFPFHSRLIESNISPDSPFPRPRSSTPIPIFYDSPPLWFRTTYYRKQINEMIFINNSFAPTFHPFNPCQMKRLVRPKVYRSRY